MIGVNANVGQTLVLISADGVRVCVNRAIATEASYVLRDLLDGQDLVFSPESNADGGAHEFLSEAGDVTPPFSAAVPSTTVHDLENLFSDAVATPAASPVASATRGTKGGEGHPLPTAMPDLMDFFAPAPPPPSAGTGGVAGAPYHSNTPLAAASSSGSAKVGDAPADDILASLWGPTKPPPPPTQRAPATPSASAAGVQSASTPTCAAVRSSTSTTNVPSLAPIFPPSPLPPPPPPRPPAEVELAFPYFTGDILERVCRHMSYRFRMSAFGTEDGCYRVYAVKTRNIPRPMTLPYIEYLDMNDRKFVEDWDEVMTVQMVKAATLLNYEELLQLASAKLASYLIDRDLEGVRTFLGVQSDFDPVEEAELRKEQATDYNR